MDAHLLSTYAAAYIRSGYNVDVAKACHALLKEPMENRTLAFLASRNEAAAKWCLKSFGYEDSNSPS